jgi:DNA-binding Lrp family transcriptional regulator
LQDPKVNIAGIRRRDLLADLAILSPTRLSRQLRRLLNLGVIKRAAGTYRYYLTKAGRAATAAAEWLTEAVVIPSHCCPVNCACASRKWLKHKGFRPILAGVDLNSVWLSPTIPTGGLGDEHRQDAVRAAHGLSALEHVHADRRAL